jgi:hypothetical protein
MTNKLNVKMISNFSIDCFILKPESQTLNDVNCFFRSPEEYPCTIDFYLTSIQFDNPNVAAPGAGWSGRVFDKSVC